MKKLLFLFSFFILTSANAMDKEQWDRHVRNQDAYHQATQRAAAEQIARISMTPEKKANVKQMLERSFTLEDGSKGKIGASVTKPVDTAKVASTLVDRLKNSKEYAKKLGKASIPAFVGTAAFHALMEGIDYVMDEGGNVTKNPDPEDVPDLNYQYKSMRFGTIYENADSLALAEFSIIFPAPYVFVAVQVDKGNVYVHGRNPETGYQTGYQVGFRVDRTTLPQIPDSIEVSSDEIKEAIKKALESNNAALAAAIAEAMKAAYTQDNSEGQPKTINPLVADAQNDMQRAVDGALDTPTTTGGTAERPEGYYKITDGDKTIEGYVKPSDTASTGTTDSTTITNPDGSTTTTGTTAQQWPGFCDWANIVCEFIDWYKQTPEDDSPELPEHELEKKEIKKDLVEVSASACPSDLHVNWSGLPFGITFNKSIEMQPYCNELRPLKYVFYLITLCLCAFMFVRL